MLRDSLGSIVASAWGRIDVCNSALETEAVACQRGIKVLLCNPIEKLCIETDCKEHLAGLSSDKGDRSAICFLLEELKGRLRNCTDFKIG